MVEKDQYDYGKCEVCGKTATYLGSDLYRWDDWDTGIVRFSAGTLHRFCEEHNQSSEEINIGLSPIAWANLTPEQKKNYGNR